jgi:hypothetical protein
MLAVIVKLPGHRPGLLGKVISFHFVPLDPAYKAGVAGHIPVNRVSVRGYSFSSDPVAPSLNVNSGEVSKT